MLSRRKGSLSATTQVKVLSSEIILIALGQGFHILETNISTFAKGENVSDVPESESVAGGSDTQLRSWLQSNYQTLGIEYILLIGNSSNGVPMMNFPSYNGNSSCPSDWPYAQLDGEFKSDKTCELHYGRFPVYSDDLNTLDKILEKTIAYESAGPDEALWRRNGLFLGPGYNSGKNMACAPLNDVYKDFVEPSSEWTAYRMYGDRWGSPTGDFDEMVGEGSSAINKNVEKWKTIPFGVVNWATHGSPTSAQDVLA